MYAKLGSQSGTQVPPIKGGNVTSAGWQVTLCDPMWHVSSRSGVATLRTAVHLLLTSFCSSFCSLCLTKAEDFGLTAAKDKVTLDPRPSTYTCIVSSSPVSRCQHSEEPQA